jgi:hypothetical protein
LTRKKIELELGAILPVTRGLWVAAAEKLQEADQAVIQMREAQDRMAYEAGWTHLVDCVEQFWVRFFDEGKAQFPDFQPWAGTRIAERKREPLLQYLIQARHQSQHGRICLNWEEGLIQVAPGFTGAIRGFRVFADGTYEIDAVPAYPSVPEPTLVHAPGRPLLPVVENKKHRGAFPPPKEFQGQALTDLSPVGVAKVALEYYSATLRGALEKWGVAGSASA